MLSVKILTSIKKLGAPGWLSWLSIWLWPRSWSRGSRVWDPCWGSVWTAQSLEPVSDSVSAFLSAPPLLSLCPSLSLKKINVKKILKQNLIPFIELCLLTTHMSIWLTFGGLNVPQWYIGSPHFIIYLLSVYYEPGMMLSPENMIIRSPWIQRIIIQWIKQRYRVRRCGLIQALPLWT